MATGTTKKQAEFLESAEGLQAKQMLIDMDNDDAFDTKATYTPDKAYPDHEKPFVEGHLEYLSNHSDLDPMHYLSNLRMKTRIR